MVVEASPDRRGVVSRATVTLPEGAIVPGMKDANIQDRPTVKEALLDALEKADFGGSELAIVIPDDTVRITLLGVESFPVSEIERQSFLRWKLKKSVPFEISSARVAYEVLDENGSVNLLTVLAPEIITRQYEDLVDSIDLHPSIVSPSTIAALNLINGVSLTGDVLFVKLTGISVVTSILIDGKLCFYRKLRREGSLESAIYPTLMYYQDKLNAASGGQGIREMIVCDDDASSADTARVARQLKLSVRPYFSPVIDDFYKPALGALQL